MDVWKAQWMAAAWASGELRSCAMEPQTSASTRGFSGFAISACSVSATSTRLMSMWPGSGPRGFGRSSVRMRSWRMRFARSATATARNSSTRSLAMSGGTRMAASRRSVDVARRPGHSQASSHWRASAWSSRSSFSWPFLRRAFFFWSTKIELR